MALDVASGSFDIPASTGNFSETSPGFQPKVLILINPDSGSFGASAGMDYTFGAAQSSTSEFSLYNLSIDSSASTDCERSYVTNAILKTYRSGDYELDFVSFDTNGFTLNVSNAPSSTRKAAYLVLGGSDISNVAVGSFSAPSSSGNDSVTGVGFQPDLVLFFSNLNGSSGLGVHNVIGIGAATDASNQWATNSSGIDGRASMDADRYQRTNRIMTQAFNKSVSWEADLVSMDADGFTINYSADTGGDVIHYIALKGDFQANVFSWDETSTSGTNVSQSVTGIGFEPSALISAGFGRPASTARQDDYSFQIGFAAGAASEFSFNATDEDGVGTTNTHQAFRSNRFYEALGVNSNSTVSDAELTSFDSDGFTVNWLNTDGGQDQILGLAIGAAGGGGSADNAVITSAAATPLASTDTSTATDNATLTAAVASVIASTDTSSATDSAQITSVTAAVLSGTAQAIASDAAAIVTASATPITSTETTDSANNVSDNALITTASAATLTATEASQSSDQASITAAWITIQTSAETATALDNALIVNSQGSPIASIESVQTDANITTLTVTPLTSTETTGAAQILLGTPVVTPALSGEPNVVPLLSASPEVVAQLRASLSVKPE